MNTCSKPGCARAGAAVLGYEYDARRAVLEDPPETGQVAPHLYVLCNPCAERLTPPYGWVLDDARTAPPLFVAGPRSLHAISLEAPDAEEEPAPQRRQLFFGYSA